MRVSCGDLYKFLYVIHARRVHRECLEDKNKIRTEPI